MTVHEALRVGRMQDWQVLDAYPFQSVKLIRNLALTTLAAEVDRLTAVLAQRPIAAALHDLSVEVARLTAENAELTDDLMSCVAPVEVGGGIVSHKIDQLRAENAALRTDAHGMALVRDRLGDYGKTDCSTPEYERVRNIIEWWLKAEAEVAQRREAWDRLHDAVILRDAVNYGDDEAPELTFVLRQMTALATWERRETR